MIPPYHCITVVSFAFNQVAVYRGRRSYQTRLYSIYSSSSATDEKIKEKRLCVLISSVVLFYCWA